MTDDQILESLTLLRDNYITLPQESRDAGLDLAKRLQEAARQQYLAISDLVRDIESITKDAN